MKFVNHVLMVLFAVAFSVVKSSPDEGIEGLGDDFFVVDVDDEVPSPFPSLPKSAPSPMSETAPCLGCPSQQNPNTKENLEKANFTLSALEMAANSKKVMSVVRVLTASSQVIDSRCRRFIQVLTIRLS